MILQFWRDHSLSIVLTGLLLTMMIVTWPLHRAAWSPDSGPYWQFWLGETILSHSADVFGAILLVVLTKRLRERGSKESK